MEGKSLADLKNLAERVGITLEKLASLSEINEEELTTNFNEELLVKISAGLGMNIEDLFEIEVEN